jgi:superoxide dismutase, Fe-Mn family
MKKICTYILAFISLSGAALAQTPAAPFKLAPLPYAKGALKPYISEKTMDFHYGKHHQAYVDTLNKLVQEKGLSGSLEEIIVASASDPDLKTVFNNAAQDWNHTFYWSSMKHKGGGKPTGAIADLINKSFGNYDSFKAKFVEAGTKQFGSGWVWLIIDTDDTLKIVATGNADLPLIHGQKALLTCDIWEHAYYLDYQNRRKDYVTVFLDHLVNWDFANQNLAKKTEG